MIEFVTLNEKNEEIDWLDPVESIEEFDDRYEVDNGFGTHVVSKVEGYTYVQRVKGW